MDSSAVTAVATLSCVHEDLRRFAGVSPVPEGGDALSRPRSVAWHQAAVPRARPRVDALPLRPLVTRGRLHSRRRDPRTPRGGDHARRQHLGEAAPGGRAGGLGAVRYLTTPPAPASRRRALSSGSVRSSSTRTAGTRWRTCSTTRRARTRSCSVGSPTASPRMSIRSIVVSMKGARVTLSPSLR